MQQQGRYAELAEYLTAWMKTNPAGHSANEQYLSALVKSDQIEKAEALVLQWLKEAQVADELTPVVAARLQAAIAFMLGQGYQLYTNRVEERWLAPLAQAALYFAQNNKQTYSAGQIIAIHEFQRTEEAARLRKKLAAYLSANVDKMPADQVQHFIGWIHTDDAEPAAWTKIAEVLRQRWQVEAKVEVKHALGQTLVSVLSAHGGPGEARAFLRLQWQQGPEKHRAAYANQLFDSLLQAPWSAAAEKEALELLDKLSPVEEPGQRLFTSVAALHRLTDKLLEARIAAGTKMLEHPEKLTRGELQKKKAENIRLAREGLADNLREEATRHPKTLAQWLIVESDYLDMLLDRDLKRIATEAWNYLGALPPLAKEGAQRTAVEQNLEIVLRQRYLVTLMNLAARKERNPLWLIEC